MKHIGLLILFVGILTAAQVAVLRDGTRIPVESHENHGPMIRLHTPQGIEEILAEEIERFEDFVLLETPPAPPPAIPATAWANPLPGARPPVARTAVDPEALIRASSEKYNVPEVMVRSIMAAESSFNPNARSPKGAIGLMQLMPATARELGYNPHIPEQNVDAGTRYLRMLLDRYQDSHDWLRRTIAAYNAGPGAVARHGGVPPFRETRNYVTRVLSYLKYYHQAE
jgi:soluble lytic murein transglycosylase-like protein